MAAARRWSGGLRLPFRRGTLREDSVAGLVLGVQSVPDGLATGLLAGANPLSGLYAYVFGTFTGAPDDPRIRANRRAARGLVARSSTRQITAADGRVVWDLDAYVSGRLILTCRRRWLVPPASFPSSRDARAGSPPARPPGRS